MKCRVLALLALLPLSAAGAPALEPGNWMFSLRSVTDGKPEPAQTGEQCLGEQLKDPAAYFAPRVDNPEAKCENKRLEPSPNTIEFGLRCQGPGYTVEGLTRVTIVDSRHFTIEARILTRSMTASRLVVSTGEALRTGNCRRP